MRHLLGASAVLSLLVLGCGSDGGSTGGDDQQMSDGGNPDSPGTPPGFTRLIGRTWSLPAGATDTYKCVRITLHEDTYITNIVAQAPAGTHHTVLSIAGANNTAGADGEYDCQVQSLGMVMLYASGVGTDPLDFPQGVGLKVAAGTQIHLNLHLFNATDQAINGDSAILVKTTPTQPAMLAEMAFAGKYQLTIPSDNTEHSFTGGCTANAPYQMFAYWPHMHKAAVHSKLEWTHNGTKTVLHDQAYTFFEQKYYLKSPEVSVSAGDRIDVTCTYKNNTGHTLSFGDSSDDEMCFTGLYRYPAQSSGLFSCVSP